MARNDEKSYLLHQRRKSAVFLLEYGVINDVYVVVVMFFAGNKVVAKSNILTAEDLCFLVLLF